MNENLLLIWFSKLRISNKIKFELIQNFENIKNIWNANIDDFLYYGFNDKTINEIMDVQMRKNLNNEYKFMVENNIKLISFKNKNYPQKLLEIYDFPVCLYYIGNIEILNKSNSLAIIGSRNASDYGKKVARKFGKEIADYGYSVISGLANGIDKYAHLGALDSNFGKTIAVLGNGVNKECLYPYENLKVYERIIEKGGLIISEYPINSKPEKFHFPARNRIISGLSDKVIVIEATQKSGSLITVDFALEQGKEVWAIPGNIFSQNSEGTNKLISEGAFLLQDIEDII